MPVQFRRVNDRAIEEWVRRKKEGEEVKITALPRHASECQVWLDVTTDSVTACAVDAEEAFALIRTGVADVKDCFHRLLTPPWMRAFFALPEIACEHVGLVGGLGSALQAWAMRVR